MFTTRTCFLHTHAKGLVKVEYKYEGVAINYCLHSCITHLIHIKQQWKTQWCMTKMAYQIESHKFKPYSAFIVVWKGESDFLLVQIHSIVKYVEMDAVTLKVVNNYVLFDRIIYCLNY